MEAKKFYKPFQALSHPLDIVKNFTPNWFTLTMGTGIVAIDLHNSPYHFPYMIPITKFIWELNIVFFSIISILFIARWIFFFEGAKRMLHHPVQSMFIGAIPMGFATIVNGFILFYGNIYAHLDYYLWWIDAFLAIISGFLVPFYMFISQEHSLDKMTGVWLLPIVPSEVTAASGGFVAPHVDQIHAQYIVYTSYILWSLSVPLAMSILVILFFRLAVHGLPPKDMAVSIWLVLGPIGTGALAMFLLGQASSGVFYGTEFELFSRLFFRVGFMIGMLLWAYGLWWFAMAIMTTLKYLKEGLPFNMGWWGFTFPLGVFTAATIQVWIFTGFEFVKILSGVEIAMLTTFYVIVMIKTLQGVWHGSLFRAPCLSTETGLPIDKDKMLNPKL
ncbi:TDT family transporter [Hydrogenobaculum acidophilum]